MTERESKTTTTAGATPTGGGGGTAGNENVDNFECNICLDTAKEAVISLCGHLFCWPCLHRWLEIGNDPMRTEGSLCPVCKAGISKENIIPVYGRGGSREDPRNKTPPRPPGQRPAPDQRGAAGGQNRAGLGFGEGFTLSFGIGAFPFSFLATSFGNAAFAGHENFGHFGNQMNVNNRPQNPEDRFLSQLFAWCAILFVLWIMFT